MPRALLVLATLGLGRANLLCTVQSTLGCYVDDAAARVLNTSALDDASNSLEHCAAACFGAGFGGGVMGVEAGSQCFCGAALAPGARAAPASECEAMVCPGSTTLPGEDPEYCGGAGRLLAFEATCAAGGVPNYMPCAGDSPGAGLPFCDASLDTPSRVADMISRMSLAQKCAQTDDKMGAMPEIGWGGYNWNTECLHGLGALCLTVANETRCPSVFAAPPLLGATFNDSVARALGAVISDELRAYANANGVRDYQNRPVGPSAWGPSLNINRDPRWGRNVEVPSEDPYHAGRYGVAYTSALQWGEDPALRNYTKAIGALKHYTIYSVEKDRGSTYFDIASRDVEETYLPQFRAPVVEAGSLGYMCSYAALTNAELIPDSGVPGHPHSEPLCASAFFAQTKMRDEFGFAGYVQSDCGAVDNEVSREGWANNATDAAARALAGGLMNSNCGGGLVDHICDAIAEGLTTEAELEARVARSLTLLMDAGLFDPLEGQPFTRIPFATINSEAAQAKNLEAARQGLVLLRNPAVGGGGGAAPTLPLAPGLGDGALLLLGPHARTQEKLAGNYFADIGLGTCAGPACIPTVESALNAANGGGAAATVLEGCANATCPFVDLDAVAAAAGAPAVRAIVLAMGNDNSIEGEGHDRLDIRLPGQQKALVRAALDAAAPATRVVLLLFNGGTIALEELAGDPRLAVVECWFPGATGGTAVADALFGATNRFGKLPVTYYALNFTEQSNFTDMNMSDYPGRTYKYLADPSLAEFPFGFGLSYTTFGLSAARSALRAGAEHPPWATTTPRAHFAAPAAARRALESTPLGTVSVTVSNTGDVAGDEVVFAFHNASEPTRRWAREHEGAPPPPLRQLCGYQRVSLAPGESATVEFELTVRHLSTVDERGTRHLLPGAHEVVLSRGHGAELRQTLDVDLVGAERLILSTLLRD